MSASRQSVFRLASGSPRLRRWLGAALLLTSLPGCSRQFWRRQADMDVYDAQTEKLMDSRWKLPRTRLEADPRSRFYDPYSADCPPLPPDDPYAHQFMHCVDGWEGYKGWHEFGDTISVENPQWLAPFGLSASMIDPATGQYVGEMPELKNLTLTDAIELSQIHSREYQRQLETLYLAALTVTFQRFQFGVRYLGTVGEPSAGLAVVKSPDGIASNDGVSGTTRFGVSQLLPSGAQFIVELTNNTIWLFGGGNQTNTASALSFQLTQPLWFGAGRKVVLEALTQAERNLLYAARDLARYRQQLFTDVVATSGSTSFLGLLQSRQQIINQEGYLQRLENQVYRLQTMAERGRLVTSAVLPAVVDLDDNDQPLKDPVTNLTIPPRVPEYLQTIPEPLQGLLSYNLFSQRLRWRSETPMTDEQIEIMRGISPAPEFQEAVSELVRQVRDPVNSLDVLQILSTYNSSQNTLRNLERTYQDNLDAYKIQLGLPPTVRMSLDESLLEQFQLIDDRLSELESDADFEFSQVWSTALGEPDPIKPDTSLYNIDELRQVADRFAELVEAVETDVIGLVREELTELENLLPARLEELSKLADSSTKDRLQIDFDRDRRVFQFEGRNFEAIKERIISRQEQLSAPRVENSILKAVHDGIKRDQERLVRFIRTMSVLQVGVRADRIRLNSFDMPEEQCLQLAIENRVDLMNERGRVMDARRQVEVAANRLQAVLSLTGQADIGTSGGNRPFNFDRDHTQFRFGVQFRAPLDQIAERNNYRAVLIDYQQARRDYMLAEDTVKQQVRRALRGLKVQEQNLETARGAVRRAALQYDATNEETDNPARATQAASSTSSGLQGQNVLNSLNAILNTQNQLISAWIDYERNRLNIYRDMGIMEIGPDGLWNDPYYRESLNEFTTEKLPRTTPDDPRPDPLDDGSGPGGLRTPGLDDGDPAEKE